MEGQNTIIRESPAADAAGLLVRIGFGLLVLAAPFSALFFRRAFVVLVPIGALLIAVSALVNDAEGYVRKCRDALVSPMGLVAVAIGLWIVMSILWTPFPGDAGERAFRTLGNAAMAAAVCAALPERMRSSNLNLMSIGVALAAVALVAAALLGPSVIRFVTDPDAPTLSRAAIAAGALVWPALAWTITRGRDIEGILLIAACGVAAIASGSVAASVVLFTALLVFLSVRARPAPVARALSWTWAGLILLAPLLALLARLLAGALQLGPTHLLAQIGAWSTVIAQQPERLLTGHGFDTIHRARAAGLIDAQAPAGLLSEVWYDLGLPGALGLAVLVFFAFQALARGPVHVAAAALAVCSSVLVFLILDPTATQQWWLSVCVVVAITMTAVHHGQYRTRRPRATMPPVSR